VVLNIWLLTTPKIETQFTTHIQLNCSYNIGFGDLKESACDPKVGRDPPVEKHWFRGQIRGRGSQFRALCGLFPGGRRFDLVPYNSSSTPTTSPSASTTSPTRSKFNHFEIEILRKTFIDLWSKILVTVSKSRKRCNGLGCNEISVTIILFICITFILKCRFDYF